MVSYTRPWTAGLLGLVLLFGLSCSGGGGNPIAPPSLPTGGETGPQLTSGAQPGGLPDGQSHAGQSASLWGIYDISYDATSGEIVVTPVRDAQFTLNVLPFLQPPAGNPANLKVQILDKSQFVAQGLLTIQVQITHPINLSKLVGFDTMGVVIGDGSIPFNEDPGVIFAGPDNLQLLNFDGYTRWMNPVEFTTSGFTGFTEGRLGTKDQDWTATVNPYKYFADGLGPADDLKAYLDNTTNQESRGAFLPGTANSREYQLKFSMVGGFPQLRFQYAILSHWRGAKDDNGDPIPNPEISDFPPDANAPEAVYVVPDSSGSTLFYNETTHASGGDLYLELTIYDWQGMVILGGTGAFNEINSFGLDSPDGLFAAGGLNVSAGAAGVTETSSGPNSTTISLLVEGLKPDTWGTFEILVAVYSEDPNTYGPNFGSAYPETARLGAYTRTFVEVEKKTGTLNEPPDIIEIQGLTEVSCWTGNAVYTCIATDPDPGDTLLYTSVVVQAGDQPVFVNPPSADNTITVDWSDEFDYPPGNYEVWFRATDGELKTDDKLDVVKTVGLLVHDITADDDDTYGVECTNTDALYTVEAESCDPTSVINYRWLRAFGDPPAKPDPTDPGWSKPSQNNSMVYSWNGTEIGDWWITAEASDGVSPPTYSPFYTVERIDTPPEKVNPPIGATEVDCNSTQEVYTLTGGEDCDGGESVRQWTITQTSDPPIGGWVNASPDDTFTVNWEVYPMGTYYAWQRVGGPVYYAVSEPLEVQRVNTGADKPKVPNGPELVDCTETNALYQAGTVGDCEGDPVTREWALGTEPTPPASGWNLFTGTTFIIDYSQVPSGEFKLYQRATDDGGGSYSNPLAVTKTNAPPDTPPTPSGQVSVTCHDDAAVYDAGEASDCDVGDVLHRYYNVSMNKFFPTEDWFEFTGDSFAVDWSDYTSGLRYLFQKTEDGESKAVSDSFAVVKGNAPPEVGPPSGPTDVDCTFVHAEYSETSVDDCDPGTKYTKEWYLSVSPDAPSGGNWTPYEGSSFFIDFSPVASGNWYLFIGVNDGDDTGISDPLHIVRHNTAPDKPPVPVGLTEVDCTTNPATYDGGKIADCDTADSHMRSHYLSTDPDTPTGGTWVSDMGDQLLVDYAGVVAEQTYYLFQKVSDGEQDAISDSLAVVYHNTAPTAPTKPSGKSEVSCANDHEQYSGGNVYDCDTWQTLTRRWALNDIDWPPSTGWQLFTGASWTIDWSQYDEGTYYLFQRVNDGFVYSYSGSLQITVGPPTLIPIDPPVGSQNLVCNGPPETYDAGTYMPNCEGADVIRDWAFSPNPTPPSTGWHVFTGTTFDVDPADLGFGYVYIFQRARLDTQTEVSSPITVLVHPGALGVPPVPIGPTTVDCDSTAEEYEMGDVTVECPGTPIERFWQVRDISGNPQNEWQEFTTSPVVIDWTQFDPGADYRLVQKAEDADHVQVSDPLAVSYLNYEPDFLGSITGPTNVTCVDTSASYDGGGVYDCDEDQDLTREWSWNTIDAYPVGNWKLMAGSKFSIDYSSPTYQPGDIYLFQRVSDGIVMVYDPVSLHVVYTNSPPDDPPKIQGVSSINCYNRQQPYDAGEAYDCDGTELVREWAMNDLDAIPTGGWAQFTGTTFDIDWSVVPYGFWYLFQRASDGEYTSYSPSFMVYNQNSPPEILSLSCDEGAGPFDADGESPGLPGLDFNNVLHFTFEADECDGEPLDAYWAVTTGPMVPPQGDPAWHGPLGDDTFTIDLAEFAPMAPNTLKVHFAVSDGYYFVFQTWSGTINLWDRVWLTTFGDSGEMWNENPCVPGEGSYSWGYDEDMEYLRLLSYGDSSESAVWSESIAFPSKPGAGLGGVLLSYINPALAEGLDSVNFAFLKESPCGDYELDLIFGEGCGAEAPDTEEYSIPAGAPIWGGSWRIGLYEDGLDGCDPSNLWVDWTGFWVRPTS